MLIKKAGQHFVEPAFFICENEIYIYETRYRQVYTKNALPKYLTKDVIQE